MQRGPASLRATFELFKYYRPEVGLDRLLQDAEIDGLSPRQIYHAVHDRPPDSLASCAMPESYNARTYFLAALSSLEFQHNLAEHLLRAFPEKRRLFFVHIPKTAGVDLATRLISRFPSISTTLLDPEVTATPTLFLSLKHVVLEMACSDTIFVSGHTTLGKYRSWNGNGIRYQDEVFTLIREPLARIISQINYTLTRIFSEETPIPPDTAGWRKEFAVEYPPSSRSEGEIRDLARRILRNPGVVVPNVICGFLGGGTCEQAVVQTVAHDLEVIELKQLDAWSEQRWHVTNTTALNSSQKFITIEDLSADDLDYADSILQEDRRYHELLLAAYRRHGNLSVRGRQLII